MTEPLATLSPSPLRRALGVGTLGLLGLVLLWVSAVSPPASLGWLALLVGLGLGALAMAEVMRRATATGLVLTREGLLTEGGEVIAPMGEIRRVERGLFAFKPSNGFLVSTTRGRPFAWAPGVWWRLGRRIGVGGVTSAAQAKAMAEILQMLLAERDGAA